MLSKFWLSLGWEESLWGDFAINNMRGFILLIPDHIHKFLRCSRFFFRWWFSFHLWKMLKVARFLNIHMLRDSPSFSLSTSGFRNFTIFLRSWLFFLRTCSVVDGSVLWWIDVAPRHLHHFHVFCLFSFPSLPLRSCRGTVARDWEAKEGQTALQDLEELPPQHNQTAL